MRIRRIRGGWALESWRWMCGVTVSWREQLYGVAIDCLWSDQVIVQVGVGPVSVWMEIGG